jgi:hypothetical protein
MDAVVPFEFTGSLDTLPRCCDLDQNPFLLDADGLVESDELLSLDNANDRPIRPISASPVLVRFQLPLPWCLPCRKRGEHQPPLIHGRE